MVNFEDLLVYAVNGVHCTLSTSLIHRVNSMGIMKKINQILIGIDSIYIWFIIVTIP